MTQDTETTCGPLRVTDYAYEIYDYQTDDSEFGINIENDGSIDWYGHS